MKKTCETKEKSGNGKVNRGIAPRKVPYGAHISLPRLTEFSISFLFSVSQRRRKQEEIENSTTNNIEKIERRLKNSG